MGQTSYSIYVPEDCNGVGGCPPNPVAEKLSKNPFMKAKEVYQCGH